jgi:hypothetical protein
MANPRKHNLSIRLLGTVGEPSIEAWMWYHK